MLAMLFQIFFFFFQKRITPYRGHVSTSLRSNCLFQPLGLTCCSPTAVRMDFFKRECWLQQIPSCSGRRTLEYLPLDWLCCLLPQAASSLGCPLHAADGSCQPCLCSPTSPRGWALFHWVLLWPSPHKIKSSPIAGKTPQNSSLISLVLQFLPLSSLCFSITHQTPSHPLVWPLSLLSPSRATLCLHSWPPPHSTASP